MELGEPAAGQLLIATEPGRGGYFDRSVVLLLEHNEEGSLGVCLHRMGEVPMVDSLEHFSDLLTPRTAGCYCMMVAMISVAFSHVML